MRECYYLPLNLTLLGSCGCAEDVCFLVVPADGAPVTVAPGLSTLSTMIAAWDLNRDAVTTRIGRWRWVIEKREAEADQLLEARSCDCQPDCGDKRPCKRGVGTLLEEADDVVRNDNEASLQQKVDVWND